MYENADDHVKQKYIKAKENIDVLFTKMSEFSSCTNLDTSNFSSWEELKENMKKLQDVLSTLLETKEQLSEVNLQVHRFTTDFGNYKDIKDDVIELYQRWDDIYEQNRTQLTELQTLCNRWEAYDQKFQSVRSKMKGSELFSCSEDCDNICPTTNDDEFVALTKELKELRCHAGYFKNRLEDGPLWRMIDRDLRDLGAKIDKHTMSVKAPRTVHHPISSVIVEDDPDDKFEDAIQHQVDDSDVTGYVTHNLKKKADVSGAKNKGSSRFWRAIRFAVPVQLALVFLFCLACYLEPNCCDMVNNFSFSFTPQLRYFKGPPPV